MKRLIYLAIVALALTGCASGAIKNEAPATGSQKTGLVGQAARIVDSLIAHDSKTFDEVQLRLRRLSEGGVPQSNYSLAKAQCWLDTARTQHNENDRSGYVEDSLAESVRIVQSLETDRNTKAGYDTPLLARSTRLRDDLWTQLAGFRAREASLVCTARTVACAEVRLVRAGHAEEQTGWRQATPHIQMVEDAIRRANAEAASCNPGGGCRGRRRPDCDGGDSRSGANCHGHCDQGNLRDPGGHAVPFRQVGTRRHPARRAAAPGRRGRAPEALSGDPVDRDHRPHRQAG